jgi:hypothetical protein
LADTSLNNVAEVDLFNDSWVDFGLLKSMLESDDSEFGCSEALESTIERTNCCP